MEAFHSFWSAPNTIRTQGEINLPDHELLTAILSALTWRSHSGPIRMITDSPGAAYFAKIGLEGLWDRMDVSLDRISPQVDPFLFWAAGKLYALQSMDTPCVMLDTDLIVWHRPRIPEEWDAGCAHPEELNDLVYPNAGIFQLKDGYSFPKEWDFTLPAANTAFLYMKDPDFRDRYTDQVLDFFAHVKMDGLNPVTAMCFAEQRMLPMCAKANGYCLGHLFEEEELDTQQLMTHVWGLKALMAQSPKVSYEFCMRCVKNILERFPQKEQLLEHSEPLKKYLADYYRELP